MAGVNNSWREQRVTVRSQTVQEITFIDTDPNYIYLANNSAYNLYFSISPLVSASLFDMIIPPYATKLYAKQTTIPQVFIANVSTLADAIIAVTSFMADFDPKALPQTQEIVGASAAGLLGVIDVFQITQPLPPGTNNIGIVELSSFPPLEPGSNNIGRVDIENFPMLPYGTNNIGKIDVVNFPQLPTGVNNIGIVNIGDLPKFVSVKITLAAGIDYVVKAIPGYVAKIKTVLTDVKLLNNVIVIWEALGSENFDNPIFCDNKIILNSAAGGIVYIEFL